ncbi:DNA polymerase III, beta subunit [Caldalkalibacillus thermarum TA2.A1]|uniref:Beta sliding clamp n=1 Tax=Caldalkalibacillus thermarum (strain TA2.A1) TaxID=986075 RepID=F5L539_CALTT|nr:DNA polymerase III subunit beta [Caldalkalibacillus thermarum]EGL83541.1 DNA polymerase III, beta subunit [Caldalkalibacillus thermarum TA2.A1]QZT34299.1 DNA polymerase III subunit beta [Caldalkalibacillus thermarum TA2.A1]
MHIVVDREALKEAVNQVSKAVSSRTTIPILTGIKLTATHEECILTGSDSDISIQVSIPAQRDDIELIKVVKIGSIVLPAKYFAEIVKKLPAEHIEIEVLENEVTHIRSGSTEFNLNGLNAEEYPRLPQLEEDQVFSIPAQLLKSLIRQTSFAVSTLESRPILTGVLLKLEEGLLTLVATDSHRLARRSAQVEVNHNLYLENVVIPGRSMNELQRILEDESDPVDIVITNNQMLVKAGRLLFYSRLLDGTYPDTERIIPSTSKTTLEVETKALLAAIERASLLAKDSKHVVKLSIQEERIHISSNTPEIGQVFEQVNAHHIEGEEIQIAFNARFMLDALRVIDSPQVSIQFTGALSPFVIKPTDHEHMLHLILPVRTY